MKLLLIFASAVVIASAQELLSNGSQDQSVPSHKLLERLKERTRDKLLDSSARAASRMSKLLRKSEEYLVNRSTVVPTTTEKADEVEQEGKKVEKIVSNPKNPVEEIILFRSRFLKNPDSVKSYRHLFATGSSHDDKDSVIVEAGIDVDPRLAKSHGGEVPFHSQMTITLERPAHSEREVGKTSPTSNQIFIKNPQPFTELLQVAAMTEQDAEKTKKQKRDARSQSSDNIAMEDHPRPQYFTYPQKIAAQQHLNSSVQGNEIYRREESTSEVDTTTSTKPFRPSPQLFDDNPGENVTLKPVMVPSPEDPTEENEDEKPENGPGTELGDEVENYDYEDGATNTKLSADTQDDYYDSVAAESPANADEDYSEPSTDLQVTTYAPEGPTKLSTADGQPSERTEVHEDHRLTSNIITRQIAPKEDANQGVEDTKALAVGVTQLYLPVTQSTIERVFVSSIEEVSTKATPNPSRKNDLEKHRPKKTPVKPHFEEEPAREYEENQTLAAATTIRTYSAIPYTKIPIQVSSEKTFSTSDPIEDLIKKYSDPKYQTTTFAPAATSTKNQDILKKEITADLEFLREFDTFLHKHNPNDLELKVSKPDQSWEATDSFNQRSDRGREEKLARISSARGDDSATESLGGGLLKDTIHDTESNYKLKEETAKDPSSYQTTPLNKYTDEPVPKPSYEQTPSNKYSEELDKPAADHRPATNNTLSTEFPVLEHEITKVDYKGKEGRGLLSNEALQSLYQSRSGYRPSDSQHGTVDFSLFNHPSSAESNEVGQQHQASLNAFGGLNAITQGLSLLTSYDQSQTFNPYQAAQNLIDPNVYIYGNRAGSDLNSFGSFASVPSNSFGAQYGAEFSNPLQASSSLGNDFQSQNLGTQSFNHVAGFPSIYSPPQDHGVFGTVSSTNHQSLPNFGNLQTSATQYLTFPSLIINSELQSAGNLESSASSALNLNSQSPLSSLDNSYFDAGSSKSFGVATTSVGSSGDALALTSEESFVTSVIPSGPKRTPTDAAKSNAETTKEEAEVKLEAIGPLTVAEEKTKPRQSPKFFRRGYYKA